MVGVIKWFKIKIQKYNNTGFVRVGIIMCTALDSRYRQFSMIRLYTRMLGVFWC